MESCLQGGSVVALAPIQRLHLYGLPSCAALKLALLEMMRVTAALELCPRKLAWHCIRLQR